ncbi:hypothetical protein LCGC14_1781470, partial [marine sediment metagenome]
MTELLSVTPDTAAAEPPVVAEPNAEKW